MVRVSTSNSETCMESPSFKQSIAKFAFASSSTSPLRRSNRISTLSKCKEEEGSDEGDTLLTPSKSSKRKLEDASNGITKKPRKMKRGYADPSKYAHLQSLSDCLAPDLDVLFCGINPGCMSATKGHHFANPTNHFWRGLHLGGFTPRLLSPSEDIMLPPLYSIGLTNLVSRVSAEQAELSKNEMEEGTPILMAKIIKHRPRIVCFVGKGIWLIIEAAFKKQILHLSGVSIDDQALLPQSIKNEDELVNDSDATLFPKKNPRKSPSKKQFIGKFNFGLQPYKFVYPRTLIDGTHVKTEGATSNPANAPVSLISTPTTKETLFFVMPSTSGRVVSHQLNDKVKLFSQLRGDLNALKATSPDTSRMTAVPLASWMI